MGSHRLESRCSINHTIPFPYVGGKTPGEEKLQK